MQATKVSQAYQNAAPHLKRVERGYPG